MSFDLVLISFFALSAFTAIIGVVGACVCARFITRGASKISREIVGGLSSKIERDIKRDIDNGKFFY